MAELRMLPLQKFLDARLCRNMADFDLRECRRHITLARQHPERAGKHLGIAREMLRSAEGILKHARDTHFSAALVVGVVSTPDMEAANV